MRLLGILLLLGGGTSVVLTVRASFEERRPRDVAFALLAPLALLVALCGALLLFVPGFFS